MKGAGLGTSSLSVSYSMPVIANSFERAWKNSATTRKIACSTVGEADVRLSMLNWKLVSHNYESEIKTKPTVQEICVDSQGTNSLENSGTGSPCWQWRR